MDIAIGLGLLAGAGVLATLIMLGGDLRMFADMHAAIVIRSPRSSTGYRSAPGNAFSLRCMSQRDLVDELAGLAEIARKSGP